MQTSQQTTPDAPQPPRPSQQTTPTARLTVANVPSSVRGPWPSSTSSPNASQPKVLLDRWPTSRWHSHIVAKPTSARGSPGGSTASLYRQPWSTTVSRPSIAHIATLLTTSTAIPIRCLWVGRGVSAELRSTASPRGMALCCSSTPASCDTTCGASQSCPLGCFSPMNGSRLCCGSLVASVSSSASTPVCSWATSIVATIVRHSLSFSKIHEPHCRWSPRKARMSWVGQLATTCSLACSTSRGAPGPVSTNSQSVSIEFFSGEGLKKFSIALGILNYFARAGGAQKRVRALI